MIPFFQSQAKSKIINESLPATRRAQLNKTDIHIYGTLYYKCLLCGYILKIKNVPNIKEVATNLCQCSTCSDINVGSQPCYCDKEFGYVYLKYLYHECKDNQIAVLQFVGAIVEGQTFLASKKKSYDSSKEKKINL